MSTIASTAEPRQHLLEDWLDSGSAAAERSITPWMDEERQSALEKVRRLGIPSTKQEAWRYSSLKPLTEQRFSPYPAEETSLTRGDLDALVIPGMDAHRAVLVNGRLVPHLSDLQDLPPGARVMSLRAMLEQEPDAVSGHLNKLAGRGDQVFTALNTAGLEDGLLVSVDPGLAVERPVEILHLSVGADVPRVAQPRHLLVLGEGARATVIERYLSLGEPLYCTNSVLELILEPGAGLDHHRIQTESPNAFHLTGLYLSQARGSRYRGLNLGLGAAWSRTDLVVRFSGPEADCELAGLYLAGDRQLVDYHLDVEHGVPHCTSRERFKGILYGRGRAVFDGRIHVARGAHKTDANLSNKNLLLSRSAEVDTKPQLEIFADDVKCSHGTTVGQIDPDVLFYLRSRGISELAARRMLCLGFAGEIIDDLAPEPLRDYVATQVGSRLEKTTQE
jgi:Fe-S cluster assembly protein SufD